MNKDVIYIDIEDDITAIIGKVKEGGAKIIALVPPKRIGVLQSVVNLKLLQKAAAGVDKRVVIITNDSSLTALAAGVKIPVAKNLQSRPEVPSIAALKVDDEEIINGQELPVGEVARSLSDESPPPAGVTAADSISDTVDLTAVPAAGAKTAKTSGAKKMPLLSFVKGKKGGRLNIPNFDTFRNKLFLFGGLGLVALIFLIWAVFIAPRATVTITARTTAVNVSKALTLNAAAQQSDTDKLALKPSVQQIKKAVATEFDATGTKDTGNKATGTMTISNGFGSDPVTLPAGTLFTSASGPTFTSNAAVTVPGAKVSGGGIKAGTATVAVTATAIGPESNLDPQSYTISGSSGLGASGTAMAGGTKETVKVVSQEDIDKAKQQLAAQNTNDIKAQLKAQFKAGEYQVIDESFIAEQGNPTASPAVGEQATRAKLTQETTFTLVGVSRNDIKAILTSIVKSALAAKTDQQQYSLGDKTVSFELFQKLPDGTFTTSMAGTAYIGPKIDSKVLAKQLAGKRFGEIQAIAQEIPGVDKVDIAFSPFWVTTAPPANKIEIKFSVANEK